MASTIPIACPQCKKQSRGPAALQGKKIRCKGCGHTFVVEAASASKPEAAEDLAASMLKDDLIPVEEETLKPVTEVKRSRWEEELDEDSNPYGVTNLDLTPRCPHCAKEMASPEATICLWCGYNTVTRVHGTTKKTIETTFGEHFFYLLPGTLSAAGFVLVVFLVLFYCLELPAIVKDSWADFLDHESARLCPMVPILFGLWAMGYVAYKYLIVDPKPPEKIKD
jgi:hypothetical protein